MKKFFVLFVIASWLYACSIQPSATEISITPTLPPSPIPTDTSTPLPPVLWIDPAVPPALGEAAKSLNIPRVDDPSIATYHLNAGISTDAHTVSKISWIYALAAPFPTVTDDVAFEDLRAAWDGSPSGLFSGNPLLMTESTLVAFTTIWGEPASGSVTIVPADQLLDVAWAEMPSWAIIPFEDISPKWKVLSIDGQSPIHKNFDVNNYPLTVTYGLTCSAPCSPASQPALDITNRDPSVMTTLIMTGVTALVRSTAATMELKGITYPGRDIGNILREADITHISNEIPFYDACAAPNPNSGRLVFCSSPRYVELLTSVGTDVVELTGNHFADYGAIAMQQTLEIYKQSNLPYFAGGLNDTEAKKPLLLENNGNKIAFIGCNRPDTGHEATASATRPGAAPCDFPYMTRQISDLSAQGYVVISTFQWNESYDSKPHPLQVRDFQMMADAGATIVSGSQAHYSQIMEFRGASFIHYGLGNMFFDQMDRPVYGTRREFMDRYVIYNGKLISIELLTNMLEDYSRPRPMKPDERSAFLSEYFALSGWTPLVATLTPAPTVTLTPLSYPSSVSSTPTP